MHDMIKATSFLIRCIRKNRRKTGLTFHRFTEKEALLITKNVPFTIKAGQVLVGWSVDSKEEHIVAPRKPVTSNLTLYPIVKIGYWITYDTNGGNIQNPSYP